MILVWLPLWFMTVMWSRFGSERKLMSYLGLNSMRKVNEKAFPPAKASSTALMHFCLHFFMALHVIIQNINIIAIMSSAFGLYLSCFIFISRREHTRSKTMNRCINISGSGSRPPPILSDLNWHTHMHISPNKQQSFLVNHNRRATQQQRPSRKDERTNHNQQATALKREFHSKYFH